MVNIFNIIYLSGDHTFDKFAVQLTNTEKSARTVFHSIINTYFTDFESTTETSENITKIVINYISNH